MLTPAQQHALETDLNQFEYEALGWTTPLTGTTLSVRPRGRSINWVLLIRILRQIVAQLPNQEPKA